MNSKKKKKIIWLVVLLLFMGLGIGIYISILYENFWVTLCLLLSFLILNSFIGHSLIERVYLRFPKLFNNQRYQRNKRISINQSSTPTKYTQKMKDKQTASKDVKTHFVTRSSNKVTFEEKERIKQEAMSELDGLVGMDDLKNQVKRFMNHIVVEKERERRGMNTEKITLHMMLLGEAGVGKTTVARILGKFLFSTDVLPKQSFIETDREGLVAMHVGETAIKTKEKIQEAMGGILFVDEAYALNGKGNDFGQEAVSTLIKAMEDYRDNLMVIFAGYDKEMADFIQMNSGLKSRVPYQFNFPNYDPYELYEIARRLMKRKQMVLSSDTQKVLYHLITDKWLPNSKVDGNGRWVRNLVEQIRVEQNNRIAITNSTDFQTVLKKDIEEAVKRMPK